MPNSYYGDRLKRTKPDRIDVFHIPYGDFISVTGSGVGAAFSDKTSNLYLSNLYLSGHHQTATGFLDYGSGAASPYGTYRDQFVGSGVNTEHYYYNNKLYYTGAFETYWQGSLKFKTKYSDKHILMSHATSGAITYLDNFIFTGDGATTGFHLHPSWVGNRAPYNELYLLVNAAQVPMNGFPSGIGRTLDAQHDYFIPETGRGEFYTPMITFYSPPPDGWRISVTNLMVY